MMDVKETAKQIREIMLLLLEGGFVMPIILTSIDRYGSLMVCGVYAEARQDGSLGLHYARGAHEERAV
jgi:hypothetical protein